MTTNRQRTRRFAAAAGAAAALAAGPLVIASGSATQSLSGEPTTEVTAPSTDPYQPPTVEPESSAPGNPDGANGDLDAAKVREAQALGVRVLAWTVNEPRDIERMLDLGVDGIVSDRPDRVRDALARRGVALPPPVNAREP